MAPKIIHILSDLGLERELVENLKNRSLNQKFQYLEEGASRYYASVQAKKAGNLNNYLGASTSIDFIRPNLLRDKSIAFISLGCGNAAREAVIIAGLIAEGYSIGYFGIDSSRAMLGLAVETLSTIGGLNDGTLVCADITTEDFREEIVRLTAGYDQRVFLFFDSTFGNVNQTNITDSLYNILDERDLLWFDVSVRTGTTSVEDFAIFNRYSKYLENAEAMESDFFPLQMVGIPFVNGSMQLASDKEESVGALAFHFSFVFKEKTVVKIRDEKIHFLPNEKIDTLTIRVYHPETLIRFFEGHDFGSLKFQVEKVSSEVSKGQFLFKKNA